MAMSTQQQQAPDPTAHLVGAQLQTYQVLITMGFTPTECGSVAQIFGSNIEAAINCILSGDAANLTPPTSPIQQMQPFIPPNPFASLLSAHSTPPPSFSIPKPQTECIQFRSTFMSQILMTGFVRSSQDRDILPTVIKHIIIHYFNLYFIKLNFNININKEAKKEQNELFYPIYVVRGNTTLRNIAIELESNMAGTYKYDYDFLKEKLDYVDTEQYSYFVHIWIEYSYFKHIYPIDTAKLTVDMAAIDGYNAEEEAKEFQPKFRWVEIPNDFEPVSIVDIDRLIVAGRKNKKRILQLGIEIFDNINKEWPFRNKNMLPLPHEISDNNKPKLIKPAAKYAMISKRPAILTYRSDRSSDNIKNYPILRRYTQIKNSRTMTTETISNNIADTEADRVSNASVEAAYGGSPTPPFSDDDTSVLSDYEHTNVTMEQWLQANNEMTELETVQFSDIEILENDEINQIVGDMLDGNDANNVVLSNNANHNRNNTVSTPPNSPKYNYSQQARLPQSTTLTNINEHQSLAPILMQNEILPQTNNPKIHSVNTKHVTQQTPNTGRQFTLAAHQNTHYDVNKADNALHFYANSNTTQHSYVQPRQRQFKYPPNSNVTSTEILRNWICECCGTTNDKTFVFCAKCLVERDIDGAQSLSLSSTPEPEPSCNEWTKYLKIGDIVDAKDEQDKWYECVIRFIQEKDEKRLLYIHYIGWRKKWDEVLDAYDVSRISKRNSKTIGPYRPKNYRTSDRCDPQNFYPNFKSEIEHEWNLKM